MGRILFFSLALLTACQGPKEANKPLGTEDCNCFLAFDPVCGEDGREYSNSCFADCHKVAYQKGQCAKPK